MRECLHCDAQNAPEAKVCVACGKRMGSPHGDRAGKRILLYPGAVLPPFCIKCGAPVTTEPKVRAFYWHPQGWYLLILAGLLLYFIVALLIRKRRDVAVPFCDAHLKQRRTLRFAALAALVLAVVAGIRSAGTKDSMQAASCVTAAVAVLASLIVFLIGEKTLVPKRIDDESAEFEGACEAFLAKLG